MLQTALALNPPATDPDVPAVVVFGLGTDGKPRASWFAKDDGAAAKAAARKMEVRVLTVTSAEKSALALRVPKGRIFSSGKAFMPLIQREVYDGLNKLAPAEKPKLKIVASSSSGDGKAGESSLRRMTASCPIRGQERRHQPSDRLGAHHRQQHGPRLLTG